MKMTGVSVPVGALRTKKSFGIGEFLDIIPFADFCKKSSLKVIQLLPVNDTGTESSPYSALSASALHPIYISIESLPEFVGCDDPAHKKIISEIKKLKKQYNELPRFPYKELRNVKNTILKELYNLHSAEIAKSDELKKWITANPWIKEYAVFKRLKTVNLEASWKSWHEYSKIKPEEIEKLWADKKLKADHLFFAWVQMNLEKQFEQASEYVNNLGIMLKGDIPIMMNEDSHDAWAHPEFFNDELRAGSPPDGPNPVGQNWGFPTYNWKILKKCDYSWWRDRLRQAAKFYQLFRIDHILGFFRIWAVPKNECTALLGHTEPYEPVTMKELESLGFSKERIKWLSLPHVPTNIVEAANNGDYLGTHGILHTIMDRIGDEELWLFKPEIKSDKDIYAHEEIPLSVREVLAKKWRDRMFIEIESGQYYPAWSYNATTAWASLSDDEKRITAQFIDEKRDDMENLWEKQARELLGMITDTTNMTACAEDLGVNIRSLNSVLNDLSIMSLKVVRWNRLWEKEGQPFIPFEEYPEKSVTTTSVHDSSTLRLWWTEEPDAADFYKTFPPAGASLELGAGSVPGVAGADAHSANGAAVAESRVAKDTKAASADSCGAATAQVSNIKPGNYSPDVADYLLKKIAQSQSIFCIHPIQDFLGLSEAYYAQNPQDERINVPGSVNDFNWTYRLPVPVETLSKDVQLTKHIAAIAALHDGKQKRS
ncbi:MAG: 4-alpha-glucanotransferase [Treponemataceae bacterium]|nr:4-alpha-glucanotransferase [Treponemataceae bacterium]